MAKSKGGSKSVAGARPAAPAHRHAQVAQRTCMQDALERSGEELARITHSLPLAIAYVDSKQRYCFTNTAYQEWLARSRDGIIGLTVEEVLGKDDYELIRGRVEAALSGETVKFDAKLPYEEKGSRDVLVIYNPYIGDRGEVEGFVAFITDVTTRNRTDAALRESEQMSRLLDAAPDGMVVAGSDGLIKLINSAAVKVLGYEPGELTGEPVEVIMPERFRKEHPKLRESYFADPCSQWMSPAKTLFARRKDGSAFPVEIRLSTMDGGEGPCAILAIRDVTARNCQEKQLQAREIPESRVERQMVRGNPYRLTFREFTVLHHVADGEADKEIAAKLGISPSTVHKHVRNLLVKMSASSRTEAATRAVREGLVN